MMSGRSPGNAATAPSSASRIRAVSYTHLDVYKRQGMKLLKIIMINGISSKRNVTTINGSNASKYILFLFFFIRSFPFRRCASTYKSGIWHGLSESPFSEAGKRKLLPLPGRFIEYNGLPAKLACDCWRQWAACRRLSSYWLISGMISSCQVWAIFSQTSAYLAGSVTGTEFLVCSWGMVLS